MDFLILYSVLNVLTWVLSVELTHFSIVHHAKKGSQSLVEFLEVNWLMIR